MKRVYIILEDGDHERLKRIKGSLTWEQYLLKERLEE
jgi:hypothetical protein